MPRKTTAKHKPFRILFDCYEAALIEREAYLNRAEAAEAKLATAGRPAVHEVLDAGEVALMRATIEEMRSIGMRSQSEVAALEDFKTQALKFKATDDATRMEMELRITNLTRRLAELRTDRADLEAKLIAARGDIESDDSDDSGDEPMVDIGPNEAQLAALTSARASAAAAHAQVAQLRSIHQELVKEHAALRQENKNAFETIARAAADIAVLRNECDVIRGERDAAQKHVGVLHCALEVANKERDAARTVLREANDKIEVLERRLKSTSQDLLNSVERHRFERDVTEKEAATLKARNEELTNDLRATIREITDQRDVALANANHVKALYDAVCDARVKP